VSLSEIYTNLYFQKYAKKDADLFCPDLIVFNTKDLTTLWTEIRYYDPHADIPYWACVWPGGRALAKYILDHLDLTEKRVLDFACGSGISTLACACKGAIVTGIDIDPCAIIVANHTLQCNQRKAELLLMDLFSDLTMLNGPVHEIVEHDEGTTNDMEDIANWIHQRYDILVAADIFYHQALSLKLKKLIKYLRIPVYISDPGRMYLPFDILSPVHRYQIPVFKEIEGVNVREGTIYQKKIS